MGAGTVSPMGRDDWYRGPDWDADTRRTFEEKIKRSRTQRSQYLRIKGLGLTTSDDGRVREAGRQLLRRVLVEHPDDLLMAAWAQRDLADSLVRDGRLDEAAEHYEAVIARGEAGDTGISKLGLVEAIVAGEWSERYAEAGELLVASGESHNPFPAGRFRWNLAAARLAELSGEPEDARELAKLALRCLEEESSPFPRHKGLGLASADRRTKRELKRLAR